MVRNSLLWIWGLTVIGLAAACGGEDSSVNADHDVDVKVSENEQEADANADGLAEVQEEVEQEEQGEKIKLTAYADEVGADLTSPEFDQFETEATFVVSGTISEAERLNSQDVWVEITTSTAINTDVPGGNRFTYYIPIESGGYFEEELRLFSGAGEYRVSIRVPSMDSGERDTYYDIATVDVVNTAEEIERDITYSLLGLEAELELDEGISGYEQAEGVMPLSGSISGEIDDEYMMLQVKKDAQTWDTLIPLEDGRFHYEVPLTFGEGMHELMLMIRDETDDLYYDAASLFVENTGDEQFVEVERYSDYFERGVTLDHPSEVTSKEHDGLIYRIAGSIAPDAPHADEVTHIIVQTVKDGDEATYYLPVEDYHFDDEVWFRFGPGEYEVTVNIPYVEEDNMAFFRFSGLSTFTQDVSGVEDMRSLLPSRGIQSDVPEIIELAEELTEGLTEEREIAKAIYAYTAQNIAYDVEKYEQNLFEFDDSALKTLDEQKGVCQDYAFLAVALFRAIGVEANFISGTARGGVVPDRHAWVEVKVDGDWLVMDPTWGAGYIQDGEFVFDYNEDYFDPDEAFFEETHIREKVMY